MPDAPSPSGIKQKSKTKDSIPLAKRTKGGISNTRKRNSLARLFFGRVGVAENADAWMESRYVGSVVRCVREVVSGCRGEQLLTSEC